MDARPDAVARAGVTVHRLVSTIYAVRSIAFGLCFVVIGLHVWERGFGPGIWAGLVAQFLLYPHLAYLRSRLARDQKRAEIGNLYADSFLLGAWIAILEFPAWIAYALSFSTTLNAVVNRGLRGLGISVACSCSGALLGLLIGGFGYWPATSRTVTVLCFFGSLAYTVWVGSIVYRQTKRMAEAREKLRASEERYRLIAENAGDLIAMVDRDGRWLYTSPSYERILAPQDLVPGADAFRAVLDDDQFRVRAAAQAVMQSGDTCRLKMRIHTLGHDIRRLEALVHPVREGTGAVRGAVMVSRDVTELRAREEQLEVAAHAFERMAEAIVITSADGRILTVNQAFSRITGYSPREVVGRLESEFRSALQPQGFYDELYAEVMRSGRWSGTTWSRRRDGTLYREWRSVSAVRDPEGRITHYVTLFRELNGSQPAVQTA